MLLSVALKPLRNLRSSRYLSPSARHCASVVRPSSALRIFRSRRMAAGERRRSQKLGRCAGRRWCGLVEVDGWEDAEVEGWEDAEVKDGGCAGAWNRGRIIVEVLVVAGGGEVASAG
jgi:hypothetical protein